MPTLHVRSVPEDLYTQLNELARSSNRSLSAQVVTLLYDALEEHERRGLQGQALGAIRRRRFAPPANTPLSTELLAEDRRR